MTKDEELLQAFAAHRYTLRPFPPYRFLPGRHPHPTASPQGHSYASAREAAPALEMPTAENWEASEEYLYGCDLYNHGYWWEAHEAWEALWHLPEKGSVAKHFLQGLIQVSARHLQLRLGHLPGIERLRDSSRAHFDEALAHLDGTRFMGICIVSFLADVDRYYEAVLSDVRRPPRHDPSTYPYVLPARS